MVPDIKVERDPDNPNGLILQIDGLTQGEVDALAQRLKELDQNAA